MSLASEAAAQQLLGEIFRDLVGFAGIEMHRRILGLAHVAELDTIEDEDLRAKCEAKCLKLGQLLVMNRNRLAGMDAVIATARQTECGGMA
jgi:5-methylthioribose kinase